MDLMCKYAPLSYVVALYAIVIIGALAYAAYATVYCWVIEWKIRTIKAKGPSHD